MPRKFQDLSGNKYGRLLVLEHSHQDDNGKTFFKCMCDCGNIKIAHRRGLLSGDTKSCGCLYLETRPITHGLSHTKSYKIWNHIKSRCFNIDDRSYSDYGGRGIIVHECISDVVMFHNHISKLPNAFEKGYSIDRKDNDGNYCICTDNLQWVTAKKQAENRRNTIWLEHNGERHTIVEWSKILNMSETAIRQRIDTLGWSVEKALTVPVKKTK